MATPLSILRELVVAIEAKDEKKMAKALKKAHGVLQVKLEVVTMYNAGYNYTQISNVLGVNKGSISRILKEVGLNPEVRGEATKES